MRKKINERNENSFTIERYIFTVLNFFENHREEDTSQAVSKLLITLMQNYDNIQDSQLFANFMNLICAYLYEDYNTISQDINHFTGKEKLEFQCILHNEFLAN